MAAERISRRFDPLIVVLDRLGSVFLVRIAQGPLTVDT